MGLYGPTETWKIVYTPKILEGGMRGVALVEACTQQDAMYTFDRQYSGQYHAIESCTKLLG